MKARPEEKTRDRRKEFLDSMVTETETTERVLKAQAGTAARSDAIRRPEVKKKIPMSIRMREKTRNDLIDLAAIEGMSITEYIDMLIREDARRKRHDLEQYRADHQL